VICGTAVGEQSARVGHYFAEKSNSFWKTLHEARITPALLDAYRDKELLECGIGLTDLVTSKVGCDNKLGMNDFDVEQFRKKICKYKPRAICFNGKKAAMVALDLRKIKRYGRQMEKVFGNGIEIFIVPSTSGSAKILGYRAMEGIGEVFKMTKIKI
jgi:TDG/mug DNA glycosylase family protein